MVVREAMMGEVLDEAGWRVSRRVEVAVGSGLVAAIEIYICVRHGLSCSLRRFGGGVQPLLTDHQTPNWSSAVELEHTDSGLQLA